MSVLEYIFPQSELTNCSNTLTNDLDRMADFLLKYQLTDDELNILKFADVGNDSTRFFTAFSRVGVIKEDCHQLVGSGDANGAELFQIVSLQHEAADKRLYEWTLNECQKLEQDAYHRGTTLRQAFMALRRRMSFYSYVFMSIFILGFEFQIGIAKTPPFKQEELGLFVNLWLL